MSHYLNKFKYTYDSFRDCSVGKNYIDVERFDCDVKSSQDLEDLLFVLNHCKNEITNLPELMTMEYLDKILVECNHFGYSKDNHNVNPTKSKSIVKLIDVIVEFLTNKDTILKDHAICFDGYHNLYSASFII
jgi:hypothetical protein